MTHQDALKVAREWITNVCNIGDNEATNDEVAQSLAALIQRERAAAVEAALTKILEEERRALVVAKQDSDFNSFQQAYALSCQDTIDDIESELTRLQAVQEKERDAD